MLANLFLSCAGTAHDKYWAYDITSCFSEARAQQLQVAVVPTRCGAEEHAAYWLQ